MKSLDLRKISSLQEMKAKEWLMDSIQESILNYSMQIDKDQLIRMVDMTYKLALKFNHTVEDYQKSFVELLTNCVYYRIISVATIQTALLKAKQ
jgi:hypothetical protein